MDSAQIDAELLALLVEIAALQAKCFRGVRNVTIVALELGENRLALEAGNALGVASRLLQAHFHVWPPSTVVHWVPLSASTVPAWPL